MLYASAYVSHPDETQTQSRTVATRGEVGEGEGGGILFNEYKTSVWDDEKVLETQWLLLHNTMNVLSATELRAYTVTLCLLCHIKKLLTRNKE